MISTIYALLKGDAELLAQYRPAQVLPEPMLYDPAIHKAHREGRYRAQKPPVRPHGTISALPHP
jgi:hypothetical protein